MSTEQLSAIVGFIREAGALGLLVGFLAALYLGKLYFGKDYDKLSKRLEGLEIQLEEEASINRTNALTMEKIVQILERSTGGYAVSVAHRISQEDGVPISDVMADLAVPKIRTREALAIPLPRPRRSRTVKNPETGADPKRTTSAA